MKLFVYPRVGLNWLLFIAFWAALASGMGSWMSENFWVFLVVSFLAALLFFAAYGLIFATYYSLLIAKPMGVLGPHRYVATDTAFSESSGGSRLETEWSGIQSIVGNSETIYLKIPGYRFHIIPRRAFASDVEFEDFGRYVHERVNAT